MKTISDLPDDLISEILSKVPITSLSALRSTCKRWNNLSKTHVFGKKAASNQQFLGFMLVNNKVCSMRFSFQGICNNDELFVDPSVTKIETSELEDIYFSRISQCDGLLLCVKDVANLWITVWNPYLGETRRIHPTKNKFMTINSYFLGYEDNKNNIRNHKILRFLYDFKFKKGKKDHVIEVFDFSSNAWRVLDINPDWEVHKFNTSVSLKGNTYFLGRDKDHLLCFDFTRESFGPRLSLPLPLPFKPVRLSCVRDEKLALLYETFETIKIWISTKIESNTISWSFFFKVDRNNLPKDFPHYLENTIFFIDEEKKLAVLSRKRVYHKEKQRLSIIGEDRFIKYVDIGVEQGMRYHEWDYSNLVRSSYVPSLVQLKL